jgi:hypothetical protein
LERITGTPEKIGVGVITTVIVGHGHQPAVKKFGGGGKPVDRLTGYYSFTDDPGWHYGLQKTEPTYGRAGERTVPCGT